MRGSRQKITFVLLLLTLFAGLWLRLWGFDWGTDSTHPEEREIVAQAVQFKNLWEENSQENFLKRWSIATVSDLSPLHRKHFHFGALPIYIVPFVESLLPAETGFLPSGNMEVRLRLLGRVISALAGMFTIVLVYLIGSRFFSRWTGLWAAALLAFSVLHIQICHFFTADSLLVLFITGSIYFYVKLAEKGSLVAFLCAALFTALAIGSEITAGPILGVFALAFALLLTSNKRYRSPKTYLYLGLSLFVLYTLFVFLEPAVFLNDSAPVNFSDTADSSPDSRFDWNGSDRFWKDVHAQIEIARGTKQTESNLPYLKTLPYFYTIFNLCRWYLGWPLGIALILGLVYFIGKSVYRWHRPSLILLLWAMFKIVLTGKILVKTPDSLATILPLLCIFGAGLFVDVFSLLKRSSESGESPSAVKDFLHLPKISRRLQTQFVLAAFLCILVTISFSAYYSIKFAGIYTRPHSWTQASEWMYKNVPSGSTVIMEPETNDFPVSIGGRGPDSFNLISFDPYLSPDVNNNAKTDIIVKNLVDADYYVFPTTLPYYTLLRLPDEYPRMNLFYRALFSGELGFELVEVFDTSPYLFEKPLRDELSDPDFTFYDHPKVCIFQKTETLDKARLKATILSPPETALCLEYRDVLYAKTGEILWARKVKHPVLLWFGLIELLGIFAFPIVFSLCKGLSDKGMAIAKCLGILLFIYAVWMLVSFGAFKFSRILTFSILILFGILSIFLYRLQWKEIKCFLKIKFRTLLAMEVFYIIILLVFSIVKTHNPDVYWGEKPMNMSFVASVQRSETFPPADPWISGKPINYYYFGQLMMGILGKTAGTPAHYTFNLASVTIPALVALLAFGLVFNLTNSSWPGMLAGFFAVLMGNFQSFIQVVRNLAKYAPGISEHPMGSMGTRLAQLSSDPNIPERIWYWICGLFASWKYALAILFTQGWDRTSGEMHVNTIGFNSYFWKSGHDIIPHTAANEFPAWSFLFADLHAHIIVMPFFLMFIALCLNILLSVGTSSLGILSRRRLMPEGDLDPYRSAISRSEHYAGVYSFLFPWRFIIIALSFGAILCINAWDMPSSIFILFSVLATLFLNYRPGCKTMSLIRGVRWLKKCNVQSPWIRRLIVISQRLFNQVVLSFVLIVVTGYLLYLPFHIHFDPAIKMGLQSIHVVRRNLTSPLAFGKIFLFFLFVMISYLFLRLIRLKRGGIIPLAFWSGLILLPHLFVLLRLIGYKFGIDPIFQSKILHLVRTYYLAASILPIALLAFYLTVRRGSSRQACFGLMLCLLGLLIAWGTEIFYIREFMGPRFNTIFKLYLEIWNLWAIAAAYFFYRILDPAWTWIQLPARIARRVVKTLWGLSFIFILLAQSLFFIFGAYCLVATNGHTNRASVPTFNGLQFKKEINRPEYKAILWMNRFIDDSPTILESHAEKIYSDYSRISMYTGLPIPLGWDNHIKERGHGREIRPRQEAMKKIYREKDPKVFSELVNEWNIQYIYFGDLETNYGLSSLERLKMFTHRLEMVFHDKDAYIFRVRPGWSATLQNVAAFDFGPGNQGPGLNMFESKQGDGNGEFNRPRGLDLDLDGNVYIADTFNHRVQKFNPDGEFIMTWGELGAMEGQFKEPNDVLVFQNKVYVVDSWNHRIQVFDLDGNFLADWSNSGAAMFGPRGISTDGRGRFFVADTGNGKLLILNGSGRMIRSIGQRGSEEGQFLEPVDSAMSPGGELYVTDSRNDRVQVFSTNGDYKRQLPVKTNRKDDQSNEAHIAITDTGRVFITDPVGQKVVEYDLKGEVVKEYTADSEGHPFGSPVGIAVVSEDLALITSIHHNAVRKIDISR